MKLNWFEEIKRIDPDIKPLKTDIHLLETL